MDGLRTSTSSPSWLGIIPVKSFCSCLKKVLKKVKNKKKVSVLVTSEWEGEGRRVSGVIWGMAFSLWVVFSWELGAEKK